MPCVLRTVGWHDMDAVETVWGPIRRNAWQVGSSRNFPMTSGVKQGCVPSPHLFSAVLRWPMKSWRRFFEGTWLRELLNLRCGICAKLCKIICWNCFVHAWFGHCSVASWLDIECLQNGSPDKWSATTTAFYTCLRGNGVLFWNILLVKNGSVVHWRHKAPNCIMLM